MGFSHGKFGLPSPGKASCDRVALPNLRCMLDVLVFPHSPNSDMDYGIFNVRTDINACDSTREMVLLWNSTKNGKPA